jgi:hypothetical protein
VSVSAASVDGDGAAEGGAEQDGVGVVLASPGGVGVVQDGVGVVQGGDGEAGGGEVSAF